MNSTLRVRAGAAILLAGAALSLAACSSDDDKNTTANPQTPAASASEPAAIDAERMTCAEYLALDVVDQQEEAVKALDPSQDAGAVLANQILVKHRCELKPDQTIREAYDFAPAG